MSARFTSRLCSCTSDDLHERAAIIEHDAGERRVEAERRAAKELCGTSWPRALRMAREAAADPAQAPETADA